MTLSSRLLTLGTTAMIAIAIAVSASSLRGQEAAADPALTAASSRKANETSAARRPVVRAEPIVPVRAVDKKLADTVPRLAPETKPAAPASSGAAYFVQAGAFLSEERAGVAASALDRLGARVASMSATVTSLPVSIVNRSACASRICRWASAITFGSPGYLQRLVTNLAALARPSDFFFSLLAPLGTNCDAGTSVP